MHIYIQFFSSKSTQHLISIRNATLKVKQQFFCFKEMEKFISKSNQRTIIALLVCPFFSILWLSSISPGSEYTFFSVFPLLHKRFTRIFYQYYWQTCIHKYLYTAYRLQPGLVNDCFCFGFRKLEALKLTRKKLINQFKEAKGCT